MDDFHARLTELSKRKQKVHRKGAVAQQSATDNAQQSDTDEFQAGISEPGEVTNKRNVGTGPEDMSSDLQRADVAIVTALRDPEFHAVKEAFSNWRPAGRYSVAYQICQLKVEGGDDLSIVAASQNTMGMVHAALLAQTMLTIWRPRLMIMAGICASVKGKSNLGDVIIANQVFDYGAGKVLDGTIQPDYDSIKAEGYLLTYLQQLADNNEMLYQIRNRWPAHFPGRPDTDLKAHIGPLSSGAAVVADDGIVAGITEHKRSLLGIDMEAYGVATACTSGLSRRVPFIIAKGVQDFATNEKNDAYRHYAAFAT